MHARATAHRQTTNLAATDGGEVVFISQVECSNPVRAFFSAGVRTPMHASGIGKALMAEMTRADVKELLQSTGLPGFTPNTITSPAALFEQSDLIRARGWSFDDEERQIGMRCVSAPIHNHFGEAIAGAPAAAA